MTVAEDKLIFPHSLSLEERKKLTVSGVSDVDNFDEEIITAYTSLGELTIKGNDLHISKLDTKTGELSVDGNISELIYSTDHPKARGFFGKLMK